MIPVVLKMCAAEAELIEGQKFSAGCWEAEEETDIFFSPLHCVSVKLSKNSSGRKTCCQVKKYAIDCPINR